MKEKGQCSVSGTNSAAPLGSHAENGRESVSAVDACPALTLDFVQHPDGFWFADLGHGFKGDKSVKKITLPMDAYTLEEKLQTLDIKIQDDLPTLFSKIAQQLKSEILATLSIARKSSRATCGFQKIQEKLLRHPYAILFIATDSTASDFAKLKCPDSLIIIRDIYTQQELGGVFGREHAVYALLFDGNVTKSVSNRLKTYKDFVKGFGKSQKHDMK